MQRPFNFSAGPATMDPKGKGKRSGMGAKEVSVKASGEYMREFERTAA